MINTKTYDPNGNIQNRVFRVFVSSTFIDMQDERQYLMETIFPRIKNFCQKRDVYFIPIDLRWGITKEQSENGQVVEVCLKSIKQSKPYFIGLLGERYGWKPEKEELKKNPNMKRDFDFLEEDFEKKLSLTEIEMQYGVLREPELMNAAFWIRSKNSIPESPSYNSPMDDKKLEALKAEVRSQSRYPVGEYASIEDMGNQVESFLKEVVEELFSENASQFEKLMVQQHSFMQQKRMLYVPRREDYDRINAFVDGSSQFFTISGDRGNGKSALISNWMGTRPDLDFSYCFVGASEMSDNPTEILKLLIAQINPDLIKEYGEKTQGKLGLDSDEKPKTQDERPMSELEKLQDKFQTAVNDWHNSNPNGKLIVIIDGINQMSEYYDSKELLWIPVFPEFVKAVFSTWEDDVTMERLKALGSDTMELEPLTIDQRKKIIKYFLEERNRELSPEQIKRIAEDKESASPIVLRTLLDELCYFGIFEKLDQQIEIYLSADSQEEFFDRVLGRLEKSFGHSIVSRLLTGLSASRFGLSNEELLAVANSLKDDSGENSSDTADSLSGGDAVNPLCTLYNWEQIAFSLDNHFMVRAGLNCFSHDIIASTAKERYQSGIKQARRQLIQYLEDNGSVARKCEEIPWLLYQLEDWVGLNRFLLDFENLNYMFDSFDFRRYWLELDKKGYTLDAYFDLDASELSPDDQAFSYFNLAVFGESIGKLHISERGYKKALEIIRSNPDMYKTKNQYESNCATTLNRLGRIYSSLNSFSQAGEMYSQAIDIYKRLNQVDPEKFGYYVAMLLNNLGLLHLQENLLDQSEKEFSEALSIYRSLEEGRIEIKYDIAKLLLNLGWLYFTMKRYSESNDAYLESLEFFKKINTIKPGSVDDEIAKIRLNMGYLYTETANYDDAESMLTEALTNYRRAAEDNPEAYTKELATTLLDRGRLYLRTKCISEAESDFIEANTLFQDLNAKYPGAFEGEIAKTQNNLGFVYFITDRFQDAEPLLNESLERYNRLLEIHPQAYKYDISMPLMNRGILYRSSNRFQEAEADFLKVFEIYKELSLKSPGVYDGDIAKIQSHLGLLYIFTDRPVEANSALHESIELYRRLAAENPGAYNQDYLRTLAIQAGYYSQVERYSDSEDYYNEALRICRQLALDNPGIYDPAIAEVLSDLARLHLDQNRDLEAKDELNEALSIYRNLNESEDVLRSIGFASITLAQIYKERLHDDSRCKELLQESLAACEKLNELHPGEFEDVLNEIQDRLMLLNEDENGSSNHE